MMGIFSFLFGGCGKKSPPSPQAEPQAQPSKPLSAPPEVTSEQEEGFRDLVFHIEEHKRLPDGSQSIRGRGTHNGRPLGLEVVLGATWKSAPVGKDVPLVVHQGAVTYRSTGPEGDAFAQVLDEVYGTKVAPAAMAKETRFTAIALEGDPRDLGKGPVRIKLFFEPDEEEGYAEVFTNIDLSARRLEVREKDPEYRLAFVKALRAR
jgi:hypothetical protein